MPTSTAASLQIFPPTLADAEELLAFESDNRAYFESWINARSDGYYHIAAVRAAIEQAARERDNDVAYQFLAKVGGRIVGRVNLTAVVRRYFNKAALGYRIAEQAGGQGYASRAVELAVREGFGAIGLWRIEADVRAANTGSQRVMERNDFRLYGKSARSMRMHGNWHDVLHFERRRDEEPSSFDDVDALLPPSQR